MTDAERALLLTMAEKLQTLLHNATWLDAAEVVAFRRLAVVEEQRAAKASNIHESSSELGHG